MGCSDRFRTLRPGQTWYNLPLEHTDQLDSASLWSTASWIPGERRRCEVPVEWTATVEDETMVSVADGSGGVGAGFLASSHKVRWRRFLRLGTPDRTTG